MMTIELNDRQLFLIRYAVGNTGNKAKADASRASSRRDEAKHMAVAKEFLELEQYLYEQQRK